MKQALLLAAFAAGLSATSLAQGFVDVASATDGMYPTLVSAYVGQSFTAGSTADDITFNFYNGSGGPVALGTGYLFSSAYTGTPAQLSSSDAGFLGSASASFGKYDFAPSLTLQQGVTYYFYSDHDFAAGSIYGGFVGANGTLSYTYSANKGFTPVSSEFLDYQVDGMTTVTPEPSAFVLLGSGVLGGLGVLRRRFVR